MPGRRRLRSGLVDGGPDGLLDDHARHCMQHGAEEGKGEEMATEMLAAVGRLLRRG